MIYQKGIFLANPKIALTIFEKLNFAE